jgi:3-deoxy-D-manno-octulosonate 8-phosphate phosphatase (KDO 8-P phosphatase)
MTQLKTIKLLLFDVDGVLTDGSILINDHGVESKRFYVRDGFAMKAAMTLGLKIGVLTGRNSVSVNLRMSELGIDLLMQGVTEKAAGFETLCQRAGVSEEEASFLGDDLNDLPALLRCGYPMAVADAIPEVRQEVRYVTHARGGRGAAREAIEHILKGQERWEELLERYGV